jgi:uncharacterized membrane protein
LVLGGLAYSFVLGMAANALPILSYFTIFGLIAIIVGIVLLIRGYRMQIKDGTREPKSDEARNFLKKGLIFLCVGIGLALGTALLFALLEPAAASTATPAAEVTTVVGGVILGYIMGVLAAMFIIMDLILLIIGWTKD